MGTTNVNEGNLKMPRDEQFNIALNQLMELYSDVPESSRMSILYAVRLSNANIETALFNDVFAHFQRIYNGLELKGSLVYLNGQLKFNIEGYNLLRNLTEVCDIIQYELK